MITVKCENMAEQIALGAMFRNSALDLERQAETMKEQARRYDFRSDEHTHYWGAYRDMLQAAQLAHALAVRMAHFGNGSEFSASLPPRQ